MRKAKVFIALLSCCSMILNSTVAYASEYEPADVIVENVDENSEIDIAGMDSSDVMNESDGEISLQSEEDIVPTLSYNYLAGQNGSDDGKLQPGEFADAAKDFVEAVEKFAENGSDMSKFEKVITRMSSATSLATGLISILEFAGVIEDPTEKQLAKISDMLKDINTELDNIDLKLDEISTQLINLGARQEEIARVNQAMTMRQNWRNFKQVYNDAFDTYIAQYKHKIREALKSWWETGEYENVAVVYSVNGDMLQLTYSNADVSGNSIPAKADNGETISLDDSFIIPKGKMPNTKVISFSADTYTNDYIEAASVSILNTLNSHEAITTSAFYTKWDSLSTDEKTAKSQSYASDLLATVIYRLSCVEMSKAENDQWVTTICELYSKFCSDICSKDSGVDALISIQYLTHGFEGEAKEDINSIFDSMTATLGYYGTFVLNIAGQDSLQDADERNAVAENWVKANSMLKQKRKGALTGKDNFCYPKGGCIQYEAVNVSSTFTTSWTQSSSGDAGRAADGFESTNWALLDNDKKVVNEAALIGDIDALVLFHEYVMNRSDNQIFADYLNKNGVTIPATYDGEIFTSYTGAQNFPFSEQIEMKCINNFGNTFNTGSKYKINNTKVENEYFVVHDKALGHSIDTGSGAINVSSTIASRAFYYEHHGRWVVDEGVTFGAADAVVINGTTEENTPTFWDPGKIRKTEKTEVRQSINVLKTVSVTMDTLDEYSPLLAFDSCYIIDDETNNKGTYESADWDKLNWRNLYSYEESDEQLNRAVLRDIEYGIRRANNKGISVSLSDEETKTLASAIKADIYSMQEEVEDNYSIHYLDALKIDNNDAVKMQLAKAVLPHVYLDKDGKVLLPADSISTVVMYEANVIVDFEDNNGSPKAVLKQGYSIEPALIIWDSKLCMFKYFDIPDDLLSSMNLSVNARIPADVMGDMESARISLFDPELEESVIATYSVDVLGSANNRYVEMLTDGSSEYVFEKTVPEKLWIEAIKSQTYTGKQINPVVIMYDGCKKLIQNADYTVTYRNNTNAYTLSEENSEFDATKAPSIVVTSKGNYAGTKTFYFTIQPKSIADEDVDITDLPSAYEGKSAYKSVPVISINKRPLTVKRDFKVEYYAEEECTNAVSPVSAGIYYAKISGTGNYCGDVVKSFEIVAKETGKLVSKLTINRIKDKNYTGSAVDLTADELVVKDGTRTLIRNTDYRAVFSNNTEIGTATVKIIGLGNYSGTKTATFKINGIALSKVTLTGFVSAFTYDGTAKTQDGITLNYVAKRGEAGTPVETVTADEYGNLGDAEKKQIGAIVTYSNNVNAGTATMVLTGVNNYSGTIRKTYRINQYDISPNKDTANLFTVSLNSEKYEYSKAGVKPVPIVRFKGALLTDGKDFTATYSNNTVVTVLTAKTVKYPTVKITGKGNFKGTDSTATFIITSKNMTPKTSGVKVAVSDKVYADRAGNWKSTVSVTDEGKTLLATRDYQKAVEYTYVSIPEGAKVYDGSQRTKPEIERTAGDIVGEKDIVPAGTEINVKVTGADTSYTGTKSASYRIVSKDIKTVTVKVDNKPYTGNQVTLDEDDLKFYSGVKPLDGVTFVIDKKSYVNNTKKGRASVTIKGTGNYGGTKVVYFNIVTKSFLW